MNAQCMIASILLAAMVSTADADPMSFRAVSDGSNMYSCCWIIAEGEITARTPADYLAFIEGETSLPSEIRLTGFGTDYQAAIELGRILRGHRLRVAVGGSEPFYNSWWERVDGGSCIDACVLVLLGGRVRSVPEGTVLSVSQFQNTSLQSAVGAGELSGVDAARQRIERQAATGSIVQYLADMDIDPRLYTIATTVELGSSGRVLTSQEIIDLNIDNAGDVAGPWRAMPFGNGFFASAETRHTNRSLMLYCVGNTTYVGFSFPMSDNEQHLRGLLARHGDNVLISNEVASGQGQLHDFFRAEDGRMFVSFRISQVTADLIATAERLTVTQPAEIARVQRTALALAFDFMDIRGNPDLPRRALQVCRT